MSFHIPLRTSSMNAPTSDMLSARNDQGDMRSRRMSKAQKILGTTSIALDNEYHRPPDKRTSRRPSFLNAPEITPKSFDTENILPLPHLRVRASSPLLGQEYRATNDPPPALQHSKKLHQSGSSSALFSHYRSRELPADLNPSFGTVARENGQTMDIIGQHSNDKTSPSFERPKGSTKDSRRKSRPPRIDLSLLFPKPQSATPPLLSPTRLMSSPSPISVTSEHSTAKAAKQGNRSPGRKLTKVPPLPRVSTRLENSHQTINGVLNSPGSPVTKSPQWVEPSTERIVQTSEMDLALEKKHDTQLTPRSNDRVRYSLLNFSSRSREQLRQGDSKSTESAPLSGKSTVSSQTTVRNMPSHHTVGDRGKETYLSAKASSGPKPQAMASLPPSSQSNLRANARKSPMVSKKSSKSALKTSDLNKSSVLCLSSSEDEDEEEDLFKPAEKVRRAQRDSVATYGESDAEICTAAAAQATKGTLRSVERPPSSSTRSSRPIPRTAKVRREPSAATTASTTAKPSSLNSQSRRSSGVPTILEPDFFHNDPIFRQMRNSTISQNTPSQSIVSHKEINRRSRLVAVTRQEEHLLEAVRQRKGKITPSLFQEALEPDRHSVISGPSRDSFYCSDTSFLRLSPGFPPPGTARTPHGASSDSEHKTTNSGASPRVSLAYSESLPSPATSGTSPLTPTLPIHRFSPLPSQKPPPRQPPPPVPEVRRQHSRRRTDSSEAIVLSSPTETSKGSNDFPIWALGWNNDRW
ncbi:hypothetical protein AOCH_002750 [Aspergillus ochraceoroseus]|uniref:Uncharacterized protein n=1 Tax=Aspergillus ochraceoroseus TaxID=138278 RepID=A0A0F8W6R6_9EURO|nr:hypothetical protein AOCH_002750 [Aspergillus ochraceoroseus]